MKVTSYGAAREVTGSKHLLEVNGARILLDCGMFQGRREEADQKNRNFHFAPESIDAMVLSHAHIDHSGVIPMLHRKGFKGRVYCTPATRDLCSVMLLDSARIQQRDAEWLAKKKQSYVSPLYDETDVFAVMKRFVSFPYEERFEVAPDVYVTFYDAGHVLGSAMVAVDYKENGSERRFVFSGDIGRYNMPLLEDPWEPEDADAIMMESTYGDREHDPIEAIEAKLAEVILRTVRRGGKVIIPSFALERAQEVVFALKRLELNGKIPSLPVYVDSPLTANITEIFRYHKESFDKETQQVQAIGGDPFELGHIEYIRNTDDSMRVNAITEPCIIIAASGMCEFGRILHHLRNNCEDERNTIAIVGFMAKNTLGRRIVERHAEIKIFGVKRQLKAEVVKFNGFSAHAGRNELIRFGERCKGANQRVMLVHGEDTALEALRSGLAERDVRNIIVMDDKFTVEV